MRMKAFLLSGAFIAVSSTAIAQSFTGPATITQPTTVGHCVEIGTNGSNNLADSGAACGSGGGAVSSVSNSDGTLTIAPTTGSVVASLAALTDGEILVGNASNIATGVALSGDCTLINTGAITCTKSNGTAFGSAAFVATGTSGTTIPLLDGTNTWSGVQSFTNGDLSLLGSSSGNSLLEAPASGGGTITLPTGTDTLAGLGATQTFTGGNTFSGTNAITLTSAASPNGIVLFSTADQVTNYEDLRAYWDAANTQFVIRAERGGTGSLRAVTLYGNGIYMRPNGPGSPAHGWKFTTSGLLAETDNSDDIGASGATRPRNIYIGGFLNAGALQLTQNVSGSGIFGTTGAFIQSSGTVTDTTSSGTVATAYGGVLGNHTWAATSATTISSAYGLFVQAPTAGANVAITTANALGVNGAIALDVGTSGTNVTGTDIVIKAGAGTGTAFGGGVTLQSSEKGSTGTTLNPLTNLATISFGSINNVSTIIQAGDSSGWMVLRGGGSNGVSLQTSSSELVRVSSGETDFGNNAIWFGSAIGNHAENIFPGSTTGFLEERNGTTNANSFCSYNTYTSSTSYERGCLDWNTSANTLIVGTEKGSGGGSARAISIVTGGTAAIGVDASQLVTLPAITTDSTHTDATLCEDTTTHAVYFGSGTLGVCLGTSSLRFKHDIRPMDVGLAQIEKLKPIIYRYNKGHGANPNKDLYGFGAEDVINVLPKLVSLDKQGKPNSVDYVGIIPVLVKAIQQQQAEIQSQAREIDALQKMRQH